MGEYDSYIDAVVAVDELGTLPPLDSEPEYDADSDTWALHFEYEDPMMGGNDMVTCLLYTSPSPRDATLSRMPSSA